MIIVPWELILVIAGICAAVGGYLYGKRAGGRRTGRDLSMEPQNKKLAEAEKQIARLKKLSEDVKAELEQARKEAQENLAAANPMQKLDGPQQPPPVPGSAGAMALKEVAALKEQVARLEKDMVKSESGLRVARQNAEKHKKAFEESLVKVDDLHQVNERLKLKLTKTQSTSPDLESEVDRLTGELAREKESSEKLEQRTAQLEKELAETRASLEGLKEDSEPTGPEVEVQSIQEKPARPEVEREELSIFDLALQNRDKAITPFEGAPAPVTAAMVETDPPAHPFGTASPALEEATEEQSAFEATDEQPSFKETTDERAVHGEPVVEMPVFSSTEAPATDEEPTTDPSAETPAKLDPSTDTPAKADLSTVASAKADLSTVASAKADLSTVASAKADEPPPEATGPTVLDVIDSDPTLNRGARETIKMVYQRFAPQASTFGSADDGLTIVDVLDQDPNLNRGQRETILTMYHTYVRKK
jgi:myosin heavy subunit